MKFRMILWVYALIILVVVTVLVGYDYNAEYIDKGTPYLIPSKTNILEVKWVAYPICEEENQVYPKCFEKFSCADFNWSIALSRQTNSIHYCSKIGAEPPCHISMIKDWNANKEYCGFERGDIIWILESA